MKLIQLISSKINPTKFLSILMIASTIGMSGCNVKEVLTDANGQKKSFILFNPNFLLTNYQIRIVDSLNKFITEDLRVEVLSNKKIVNDEGYYTESFTTSNGVLNFSVDPNENISATDSIEFSVLVRSDNQKIYPAELKYKGSSKFDRIFKMTVIKAPINTTSSIQSYTASNLSEKKSFADEYILKEKITINGEELGFKSRNENLTINNVDPAFKRWGLYSAYYNSLNYGFYDIYNLSPSIRSINNTNIKVTYRNIVDLNTMDYTIDFWGSDKNNKQIELSVNRNGSTLYFDGSKYVRTPPITNWDGNIPFPIGTKLWAMFLESRLVNSELKDCTQGFNFNFTNIPKGASPEFEFIAYRNDDNDKRFYISNAGVAKVDEKNPTYNTGEILYSNISNKVVFKENSQYYLEPNTLLLNGAGACNSKSDIKIIPRANMVKYKLVIEAQCKESNYAVTPSNNLLFRKKGTTEWEGLSIKNGISTIYLENNAEYEVTGTSGKYKLDFNFSNNPAAFETQKTTSLSKNSDLNNMIYSIEDDAKEAGTKLLKMKIIFNQSSCPFN
jgi:hypothetical protein